MEKLELDSQYKDLRAKRKTIKIGVSGTLVGHSSPLSGLPCLSCEFTGPLCMILHLPADIYRTNQSCFMCVKYQV